MGGFCHSFVISLSSFPLILPPPTLPASHTHLVSPLTGAHSCLSLSNQPSI